MPRRAKHIPDEAFRDKISKEGCPKCSAPLEHEVAAGYLFLCGSIWWNGHLTHEAGACGEMVFLRSLLDAQQKQHGYVLARIELFVDEALNHGTLDDCTYCPTTLFKGKSPCPIRPDGYDTTACRQRLIRKLTAWFTSDPGVQTSTGSGAVPATDEPKQGD